ncbi:hypothetical protein D3C86_854850 [compost metagenome]
MAKKPTNAIIIGIANLGEKRFLAFANFSFVDIGIPLLQNSNAVQNKTIPSKIQ